jgi:hypothetical protein
MMHAKHGMCVREEGSWLALQRSRAAVEIVAIRGLAYCVQQVRMGCQVSDMALFWV